MEKVIFKEEQRGDKNKLLVNLTVVFVVAFVVLSYWFIRFHYTGKPLDLTFSTTHLLSIVLKLLTICVAVVIFNSIARLTTKIFKDHIVVSYFPFRKTTKIFVNEIRSYKIRRYRAYREYFGYGKRNNQKRGKAYIISGNIGLQLYLKNGEKLLIGTQNKQAIEYAMEKLMKRKK